METRDGWGNVWYAHAVHVMTRRFAFFARMAPGVCHAPLQYRLAFRYRAAQEISGCRGATVPSVSTAFRRAVTARTFCSSWREVHAAGPAEDRPAAIRGTANRCFDSDPLPEQGVGDRLQALEMPTTIVGGRRAGAQRYRLLEVCKCADFFTLDLMRFIAYSWRLEQSGRAVVFCLRADCGGVITVVGGQADRRPRRCGDDRTGKGRPGHKSQCRAPGPRCPPLQDPRVPTASLLQCGDGLLSGLWLERRAVHSDCGNSTGSLRTVNPIIIPMSRTGDPPEIF